MPDSADLLPGGIQFYDNTLPALPAGGGYTIAVSQEVYEGTGDTKRLLTDPGVPEFKHEQSFAVAGARFVLDPADVYSVYPAANSEGDYGEALPHIVLARPTLPWARRLDPADPALPWLAVLLFDDPPPSGSPAQARTLPVGQVVGQPEAGVRGPSITPERYESGGTCQALDVEAALFKAIAPARDDLACLAHVRRVNTGDKEIMGLNADGWFSVVIGNRLPAPSGRGIAHLVSLEGFADYLPDPARPGGGDTGGFTTVRLVSLASWSFTSRSAAQSFKTLMNRMARQATSLQLPLNPSPGGGAIYTFTASPDLLNTGEQATLSWQVEEGATCTLDLGDGSAPIAVPVQDGSGSHPVAPAATTTYTLTATDRHGASVQQRLTIVVNPSPAQQLVHRAFAAGYVPLSHATRRGDATVAWYRGPLAPIVTTRELRPPYHSAAEAMIYDPATGLFDQSYAAAWQIGRLLALADGRFPADLLTWRGAGYDLVDLLNERLNLFTDYDQILNLPDDLTALTAPRLMQQQARKLAARLLAATVLPAGDGGSPPIPVADPSGLAQRAGQVPGLLARADLDGLAASGRDPVHSLLARAFEKSRGGGAA